MVLQYAKGEQCKKCSEQYTNATHIWCKPCKTNYLKAITNWSSNEKINDFIQEIQLKFDYRRFLFEWIPYNQFNIIKKMGESDSTTAYLAIWKDGPLRNLFKKEQARESNKIVILKYLYNSQQNVIKFLNEVWNFFMNLI